MKHYTYLITYPDGQAYHGVRSCYGIIENDSYMGSSKYTPSNEGAVKEILSTHDSREEAMIEEVRYHNQMDVKNSPQYYNKSNAMGTGFGDTTISKQYEFTHTDGRVEICSRKDLYRKYSLNPTAVHCVAIGTRKEYEGWTAKIEEIHIDPELLGWQNNNNGD